MTTAASQCPDRSSLPRISRPIEDLSWVALEESLLAVVRDALELNLGYTFRLTLASRQHKLQLLPSMGRRRLRPYGLAVTWLWISAEDAERAAGMTHQWKPTPIAGPSKLALSIADLDSGS